MHLDFAQESFVVLSREISIQTISPTETEIQENENPETEKEIENSRTCNSPSDSGFENDTQTTAGN